MEWSDSISRSTIKRICTIDVKISVQSGTTSDLYAQENLNKSTLMALDELFLDEGDWIDIGAPLVSGEVFPVINSPLFWY